MCEPILTRKSRDAKSPSRQKQKKAPPEIGTLEYVKMRLKLGYKAQCPSCLRWLSRSSIEIFDEGVFYDRPNVGVTICKKCWQKQDVDLFERVDAWVAKQVLHMDGAK